MKKMTVPAYSLFLHYHAEDSQSKSTRLETEEFVKFEAEAFYKNY